MNRNLKLILPIFMIYTSCASINSTDEKNRKPQQVTKITGTQSSTMVGGTEITESFDYEGNLNIYTFSIRSPRTNKEYHNASVSINSGENIVDEKTGQIYFQSDVISSVLKGTYDNSSKSCTEGLKLRLGKIRAILESSPEGISNNGLLKAMLFKSIKGCYR